MAQSVVPGANNGTDSAPKLFLGFIWESSFLFNFENFFVAFDDSLPIFGGHVGIGFDAFGGFDFVDDVLKFFVFDVLNNVAVHLNKTAVRIPGKTGVACTLRILSTTSSFRPRLRMVSIMPGMEEAAPERTETSSGFLTSPNFLPVADSSFFRYSATSDSRLAGY